MMLLLKLERRYWDKASSRNMPSSFATEGFREGKTFERVPSLRSPYQRPATASWWLNVPVLWAAAKSRRLTPRLANNSLLAQHMLGCQSTNLTVPSGHLHMSFLALFVMQVCCMKQRSPTETCWCKDLFSNFGFGSYFWLHHLKCSSLVPVYLVSFRQRLQGKNVSGHKKSLKITRC